MEAIKVNLIPNGIPEACHASQYDEGRQIRLDLFDGLTPYTIQAGDTFTLNVRKPDNHVITETVTGTEGNTYLVIDTTEQMTAVTGENLCEIRVINGGDNIGSLNFIMQVEKDVIANGIPSESVIEDLEALVIEAVGDNYYNKSETDELLSQKADVTDLLDLLPTDNASGAIANFTDGADDVPVKALSVEFAATQDLHGQSAPYPAGGSAQIWDEVWELGMIDDSTGNNTPNSTLIRSTNYIPVNASATYYFNLAGKNAHVFCYDENKSYLGYINLVGNSTFTPLENTAFIRFRMNTAYGTTYNHDLSINYPATDTAYHPYSNICPITPVNSVKVTRTGKNLFDKTKVTLNTRVNTAGTAAYPGVDCSNFIKVPTGDLYISNVCGVSLMAGIYIYNKDKEYVRYESGGTTTLSKKITIASGECFVRLNINHADIDICQLELGSTATAYEAYNGVTKTLDLGGDYYGGEVDALSGEITALDEGIDLSELTVTSAVKESNLWRITFASQFYTGAYKLGKCNKLTFKDTYAGVNGNNNTIGFNAAVNKQILIRNDEITTSEEMIAFVATLFVVYPLATPATAQASNAIELNTLLGDNNIFSDAGDVDVTIRADIALYIQKMLGGNANRSLGANPSILRTGAISTDIEVSEPVELEREVTEQPENEGNDNEER